MVCQVCEGWGSEVLGQSRQIDRAVDSGDLIRRKSLWMSQVWAACWSWGKSAESRWSLRSHRRRGNVRLQVRFAVGKPYASQRGRVTPTGVSLSPPGRYDYQRISETRPSPVPGIWPAESGVWVNVLFGHVSADHLIVRPPARDARPGRGRGSHRALYPLAQRLLPGTARVILSGRIEEVVPFGTQGDGASDSVTLQPSEVSCTQIVACTRMTVIAGTQCVAGTSPRGVAPRLLQPQESTITANG